MKKIVFFNHKGGVSKTTSTFHIGWKLALTHRVLLVDADPQCNLSALILGDDFDSYYENDDTKAQNIKDGVAPAFDGKPIPIRAVDCRHHPLNDKLFLLAGHMNLSEYDSQLNFAQTASDAMLALKSLPGAFNDLISKTAEKYNIDYVLVDLNPGLSALNENFFITSDAFIIPTNPDIFSVMAMKSLSVILPKWVKWKLDNLSSFNDSAYPLPTGTPKLIGVIIQRFNIRNRKPAAMYQNKIEDIKEVVSTILYPTMRNANMLFSTKSYNELQIGHDLCIGEVKDFQGLGAKYHELRKPVYEMTDREMGSGAALAGMQTNRKEFNDLYTDIANVISTLLPDEAS